MGRPREGRGEKSRGQRHQPQGRRSVSESRPAVRAGQGRHVQRLRMGQLLPGGGDRGPQPPARPPRDRCLFRPRRAAGLAGLHAAAARQQDDRRAVLFRHSLYSAPHAGGISAARPDQALPRAQRLALSAPPPPPPGGGGGPPRRGRPRAPNGPRYRLDALMRGQVEATTLTEPHVTLAEKKGCRIICSAFFHGTEVASERVDADTYAAFNRAVREAVRRINGNKGGYLHYFIDYYAKNEPEIAALKLADLRESRLVVCDPAPIPLDELQRTYDWLKSWDMLEETASPLALVNMEVQQYAHEPAE